MCAQRKQAVKAPRRAAPASAPASESKMEKTPAPSSKAPPPRMMSDGTGNGRVESSGTAGTVDDRGCGRRAASAFLAGRGGLPGRGDQIVAGVGTSTTGKSITVSATWLR